MAEVTQAQIEQAIGTYVDPHLEKDLVSAKAVKDIAIEGGSVTVQILLGYPAKGFKDRLIAELTQAVTAVEGVGDRRAEQLLQG